MRQRIIYPLFLASQPHQSREVGETKLGAGNQQSNQHKPERSQKDKAREPRITNRRPPGAGAARRDMAR
jgi:hypothetical protein